jgi:hypothetical protein
MLRLLLATAHSHFTLNEVDVEPDTGVSGLRREVSGLSRCDCRGRGSAAGPFCRWLAVVDKLFLILSEEDEHKRVRRLANHVIVCMAVVAICDLWRGSVYSQV